METQKNQMSIATVVRFFEVAGELESSRFVGTDVMVTRAVKWVELTYRFRSMVSSWAALSIMSENDGKRFHVRTDCDFRANKYTIAIQVNNVDLTKFGLTRLLPGWRRVSRCVGRPEPSQERKR